MGTNTTNTLYKKHWAVVLCVFMTLSSSTMACASEETYQTRMAKQKQENMKKLQEQEKKREEQRRKREEKEARKKNLAEKIKAPDGVIKNVYINYLAFYEPKWSF